MRRDMWVVLVALTLVLAACGGGTQPTTEEAPATTGPEGATTTEAAPVGEAIRVGALYPLTGSAAATGERTLNGVRLAAEIVNGEFPDLDPLPLASQAGLAGLGGATVEIASGDHEGDPETGASETERMITSEGVTAVVGAYFSSVTKTASERAERLQVPFVNGSSSSTALTEDRDLQFFFRTGPNDRTFAETFFEFLGDLQEETGQEITQVAVLHENTAYGSDAARITQEVAAELGYEVVLTIAHGNDVDDVTPEATRVADQDPPALFMASYTPEAILFTQTFKQLGYTPNILAYGAGFSDASYFEAVGGDGEYVISRAAWGLDAVRDRPHAVAVAEMFEERYGYEMDENSARTFTGALTLFHAMDQAGSTEPEAIREALAAYELPAEQTIMPWEGIRFDETGQNVLAKGVILQFLDGEYKLVWPFEQATADVVWPIPSYDER